MNRAVKMLVASALFGLLALRAGPVLAAAAALMEVGPGVSFVWASSGNPGGPFTPSSFTYTVTNRGTSESLNWSASKSQPWVQISSGGGVLAPGRSATVTVSIDELVAANLPGDGYSDPIVFTNLTNNTFLKSGGSVATGSTSRYVTLNVLRPGDSFYQGFGATTRGGANGEVFHVTTLEDNGDDLNPVPGSLRAAVAGGNRYIVFDVAGTIVLKTHLWVPADHLTIDGLSAPEPGITLTRYGIILRGNRGAHDIIVSGLRIRDIVRSPTPDTQFDGIQIAYGAFNIVVDRVSVHGADDGNIDITDDAHDVAVSWSILGRPKSQKNMLIKYNPSRVTLHHVLFTDAGSRNPQIAIDNERTAASETTVDMRNNLIWDVSGATLVWKGAKANVVDNYYSKSGGAIKVQRNGRAYVKGNIAYRSKTDINRVGKESVAFPAPALDTTDAATAACQVFNGAGMRPPDAIDAKLLAEVTIPGCASQEPPSVAITGLTADSVVAGTVTLGAAPAGLAEIAAVRFFLDGIAITPEVTAPFSISWDSTAAVDGPHALHVRARDAAGNLAYSTGVRVIVDNGP